MSAAIKRIGERINAYREQNASGVTQLQPEAMKDLQVSLRIYPFLLYRLEIIARNARMSRSQLMIELLQDQVDEALEAMDPALRKEIDAEVNERLKNGE